MTTATLFLGEKKIAEVEVVFTATKIRRGRLEGGVMSSLEPGGSTLSFLLATPLPPADPEPYYLHFASEEPPILFVTFDTVESAKGFCHTVIYPQ